MIFFFLRILGDVLVVYWEEGKGWTKEEQREVNRGRMDDVEKGTSPLHFVSVRVGKRNGRNDGREKDH